MPDWSVAWKQTEFTNLRPTYQQFMPIFDTLDAAGWNPITAATSSDSTQILERFGPDSSGAIYYVLRNPNSSASTVSVTVTSSDLGWTTDPNVTVTSLYGTAPGASYDGNGNLVLSFGSVASLDDRVVAIVYNGTPSVPVANFSGSPTSGSAPLSVTFTDSSTQTPTAWYWDFGDGNNSVSQNPSHTYTSGGRYIVSLTVSNASGQNTILKDSYITVNAAPVAAFVYDRVSGVVGEGDTDGLLPRSVLQQSDLLVLELRGRRDGYRAEPEPHVHGRGHVHGVADRVQRLGQQHLHQDELGEHPGYQGAVPDGYELRLGSRDGQLHR